MGVGCQRANPRQPCQHTCQPSRPCCMPISCHVPLAILVPFGTLKLPSYAHQCCEDLVVCASAKSHALTYAHPQLFNIACKMTFWRVLVFSCQPTYANLLRYWSSLLISPCSMPQRLHMHLHACSQLEIACLFKDSRFHL